MRKNNNIDTFTGNIGTIREIEDCIRQTKKYTEGLQTAGRKHPIAIQGEDFSSRTFCKHYEVYPDLDISWDMLVDDFMDWLWKDVRCINVMFYYDYRGNKAYMYIKEGIEAVKELNDNIPGMRDRLVKLTTGKAENAQPKSHYQKIG